MPDRPRLVDVTPFHRPAAASLATGAGAGAGAGDGAGAGAGEAPGAGAGAGAGDAAGAGAAAGDGDGEAAGAGAGAVWVVPSTAVESLAPPPPPHAATRSATKGTLPALIRRMDSLESRITRAQPARHVPTEPEGSHPGAGGDHLIG